MSRNAPLEIRVQSDNEKVLEFARQAIQGIWPLAFISEIAQNTHNPKLGWYRAYLTVSMPVPEEEED